MIGAAERNVHMYLQTAIAAARIAGETLLQGLNTLHSSQIAKKMEFDYVTEVDKRSEEKIIEHIRSQYPEHEILAEESGTSQRRSDYRWIIDPLDGTKNYIHGFPMFAVSIALAFEEQLIVGVIFDPVHQELFHAERGKGAFLNDKPIAVSETRSFHESLLGTGFPFRGKHLTEKYFEAFIQMFHRVSDFRRPGAAALDLAYLACGRLDGFWEILLNTWDIAAGTLIIEEAGGKVTDLFGGNTHLQTGNIVASNARIHDAILEIVRPTFHGIL